MIKQVKDIPGGAIVKLTPQMLRAAARIALLTAPLPSDEELVECRASPLKMRRVELGLALLQRVALPNVCYDQREIAQWCGCTHQAIDHIEKRALRKLFRALAMRDPELFEELRAALTALGQDRSVARAKPKFNNG